MTRQDAPDYIAKDFGVVRFSKIVVRDNDACNVSEAEFTKAVNVEASRRWPDMRPDAAFAKLISGESEDAVTLRRALQVIKVNQFAGAGYPYPA